MRIGIDARYLSHGLLGGVHTYVYNFISELARLDTDDRFFLYADTKNSFELTGLPDNFTIRLLPWRNKADSLKTDLLLRRQAARDNLDLLHFPANYGFGPPGVPVLITLHDAINIFPLWEATKRDFRRPRVVAQTLYLQAMTRLSLDRAALILTVSEYSAHNIVEVSRGKIPPDKLKVIYSAPGSEFRPLNDPARAREVRRRLELPENFILADGLKNPRVILRAWERLPENLREENRLVFFSRRPDLLPVAREAVRQGRATLILRPAMDELVALYSLARLFLFPSWIEGFGLPILEAMACGTPVIASDRGSIPEIGGPAAYYHDAEDDATLAGYIEDLLASPARYKEFKERGLRRAGEFSWQRTAKEINVVYREYSTPFNNMRVAK